MHVITLAGSEHQKSRLRNGHKVRVKHGSGFNVIVSPNTYHLVSKAFNKGKGTTMQLSPEEIAMNKAPSPEMQRQIMGHNDHLILPTGPNGELIKGSGIGDWFKNVGNQIKSGFENKIINPVKENIIKPAEAGYNQYIKPHEGEIKKVGKVLSPQYAVADTIMRLKKGDKIQDIMRDYRNDFVDVNNTKNKIIKSNPILTDMYKKGVPALAGLATGAIGSAFGLSPVTGALVGAAGAKGADELLKAEGYGLHHMIRLGAHHHYHKHKRHCRPIGGALGFHHISNFFKNAGNKVKDVVHNTFIPMAQQGYKDVKSKAIRAHNWLLDHPEFAAALKEHGSKLAGLLAKEGIKYMTGNEDLANLAGDIGNDATYLGAQELGYGLSFKPKPTKTIDEGYNPMHPTTADYNRMVSETGAKLDARKASEKAKIADKAEQARLIAQHNANFAEQTRKAEADKRQKNMEFDTAMQHQEKEHKALKEAQAKANKEQTERERDRFKNRSATNAPMDTTKKPGFWTSLLNWFSGKKEQPGYETQVGYHSDPSDWKDKWGSGLGTGLYAGGGSGLYAGAKRGTGFKSYHSLHEASEANAHANDLLANMSKHIIHSQHLQEPIKKYYDDENAPPSRGTGVHPHNAHHIHQSNHLHHREHNMDSYDTHNLIRGRGTLIEHDAHLPQALTSQPYGANFHMQFQLPPQYQKYNDGTYTY